jgi:uncharacterized membrane protein YbhN (UPF0104 family)
MAFQAASVPVSWWGTLIASTASDLMFVVSITPGAIGLREAAIALLARKLGTTTDVALTVAIIDRLVFSMTICVLAQTLYWYRTLAMSKTFNLKTDVNSSSSLAESSNVSSSHGVQS